MNQKDEILSPSKLAWRSFKKHKLGVVGSLMVIFLILIALFGNFIANPNNPQEQLDELRFSLYAESSFVLAKNDDLNANNTVDAGAPILYSGETVATPTNTSGTPPLAMDDYLDNHLAPAIQDWENQIPEGSSPETIFLAMTIYSNVSTTQLPLVIYSELDLPADE